MKVTKMRTTTAPAATTTTMATWEETSAWEAAAGSGESGESELDVGAFVGLEVGNKEEAG